jgi:hypothetical protein
MLPLKPQVKVYRIALNEHWAIRNGLFPDGSQALDWVKEQHEGDRFFPNEAEALIRKINRKAMLPLAKKVPAGCVSVPDDA